MEDPPADSGGGGGVAADEGPAVQVVDICWPTGALPLRLLEWKVKPGSLVKVNSVLALCAPIPQEKGAEAARLPEKKVKSDRAGVVKELCCQLGQVIPPGLVTMPSNYCCSMSRGCFGSASPAADFTRSVVLASLTS